MVEEDSPTVDRQSISLKTRSKSTVDMDAYQKKIGRYISRSPREGVDTCRDRALNASGRGYYDQTEADKAVKATHGTQVPL